MAVADDTILLAASRDDGVYLVASDLDGVTTETWLCPPDVVASLLSLPDGRFALLLSSQLVLLDPSREVQWQRPLAEHGASGETLAYDAVRDQLVVFGATTWPAECTGCDASSFIGAFSSAGELAWELRREAWNPGPVHAEDSHLFGYPLGGSVDATGNIIALGSMSSRWLTMLWVGTESCGG